MMRYLQKLGKALFLPVSILPICGILMGLGYALAPAAMDVPDYPTEGAAYIIGFFLIKAGGALINHIDLLFAVFVAVGLSGDEGSTGAMAGLVSWLMVSSLLSPEVVQVMRPTVMESEITAMAFENAANPFIGILCGILGSVCCNRFIHTRLPEVLSFFSGKRSVTIATALSSIAAAAILLYVWPVVFSGLVALGRGIKGLGVFGVGLYAFLNRLLIPTGLHHALNNVFWFDTIGMGDLQAYWGGLVQGDLFHNAPIDWDVGMYMSGFFPSVMFGIPGAALAMIHMAKGKKHKATVGAIGTAALCAFLCGITEPFEFSFMFLDFPLYVVYALLYAIFAVITVALGYRGGFCFSAGLTDAIFSSFLPAARNSWLLIPLGIAAFVVFYLVFVIAIWKWELKTPGREVIFGNETEEKSADFRTMAAAVLRGLGGKNNLISVDHCATRLRLEVRDPKLVNIRKIKAAGAAGVIRPGENTVQVVIGPKVQFLYDAFEELMKET